MPKVKTNVNVDSEEKLDFVNRVVFDGGEIVRQGKTVLIVIDENRFKVLPSKKGGTFMIRDTQENTENTVDLRK